MTTQGGIDPQRDPWSSPYTESVESGSNPSYPPPGGEPVYAAPEGEPASPMQSEPTTKRDAAKQEAVQVKDTATDAGRQVAGTAKEEAANVVAETKTQAKSLLSQARDELSSQGSTQKDRLAGTLHGFSKELGAMASGSSESGPITDLALQASRKGGEIAHWLENHDASDVLAEVKSFARRRPVAFLALAAAAGVLVGRIGRGTVAANTSLDSPDSDGQTGRMYAGTDTLVGSQPLDPAYSAGGVGAAGVGYEADPAYVAAGADPAYAGATGYAGQSEYGGSSEPGSAEAPVPGYPETPDARYPENPDAGNPEAPQFPAQGYDQGVR